MSDEDLRALERRWLETGSLEDEVAYLRARIRQGQIPTRSFSVTLASGQDRGAVLIVEPWANEYRIPRASEIELVVTATGETLPWIQFQETTEGCFYAYVGDDYEVLWKGKPLDPFTDPNDD